MDETRWLDAEEQRTWRAFLEATQLLFGALDRQLQRDSGLPHGYYEILVRLSEAPGRSLRMGDLAEASQSSRSRLSHAISRLEENGWVRRDDCPTDRRGQVAVLTDAGLAALAAAAPGHVRAVREHLLDPLGPEHVAELRRISERLLARLQAGAPAGEPGAPCPPAAGAAVPDDPDCGGRTERVNWAGGPPPIE